MKLTRSVAMKTTLSLAGVLLGMSVGTSHAATLYSENFNGEGTTANAYDDGTTPEINVGGASIGTLQSSQTSQGGNAGDTAWRTNGVSTSGLRFGSHSNWATSTNSAAILSDGGFSISFDLTTVSAGNWAGVWVGSFAQNVGINAATVDLGALVQGDGTMQTHDNGAGQGFGTVTANATRSAIFSYAFNSFASGTTVSFTGKVDGVTVATDSFTWDTTDDVRIFFSGLTTGINVDNIVVSTIPEPSAALLGGLGMLALLRRRRN